MAKALSRRIRRGRMNALGLLAGLPLAALLVAGAGFAHAQSAAPPATSSSQETPVPPGLGTAAAQAPSAVPPAPADHAPAPASQRFTRGELETLLQRLEADGYPREMLNRVFYDERLHRLDRIVTFNVLNPDSARIYEQFLAPFAIKLAKDFRRHNARDLDELQQRFGVSPEVIVGILLVETQFGTAALRYRPIEVFTTLIVDANPVAIDRHYRRMKADYPDLDRAWVEARLAKKAGWAYDELKALLSIREQLGVDHLYEVKGSYAGAFGMPQFMPSSYAQCAVDGNHDRRVDLDNPADAMASIANFLVQHGWRTDASLEQKMRAVWEYNRSMHYVRTIFGVALGMTRPTVKRGSAPAEVAANPREPGTAQAAELDAKRIDEAAAQMQAHPRLPDSAAAGPAAPLSAAPDAPAEAGSPPHYPSM